MSMIGMLNHANVVTTDLARCAAFYELLGLRIGPRPDFPTKGIWMYLGDHPMVHLNEPTLEESRNAGFGPYNHVGFNAHGSIEQVTARLSALKINYDLWEPLPGARRALYFTGLAGEKIEFVFVDVPVVPLMNECDQQGIRSGIV